jgi:heme/copper-type cytochrome/quinol oxidase subunit 2
MRVIITALALVVLVASETLFACPHCFGAEETSLIDGAKLGILAMLGITFTVQGAFAGFFFYLRRRAKRIAEADLEDEWSELQRGSRTS